MAGDKTKAPSRKLFWCLACQGLVVACIAVPLLMQYMSLHPGQPFAVTTKHNGTEAPSNYHSRYRAGEYKKSRQYFQWWNFLVYDSQEHDHWTIIYSIERPPEGSKLPAAASVAMVHYTQSQKKVSAVEKFPLRLLHVSNDFDLRFMDEEHGRVPHTLTAISDDQFHLKASFPEKGIEWDLNIYRVHGFYGSEDAEAGNVDGVCTMLSTLFSHDSEVEGTITERGRTYTIKREPRFRSYAAGSWGCNMPKAGKDNDPIDFPWSWFWLVVPRVNPAEDIGMVFGTGRFDFGFPLGAVDGGYGTANVGSTHISGRYAKMFHNTSWEIPLQASSSDYMLRDMRVERSQWTTFTDHLGSARIPLRQTFIMDTAHFKVKVDFHSKIDQYFRLPAALAQEDGSTTIFSDFRAVGVRTHVQVLRVAAAAAKTASAVTNENGDVVEEVLYDDWTSAMNAVEYAYAAPLTDEQMALFFEEEKLQYR